MSVKAKDYVAGWLDSSIHDFLAALSPNADSTKYVLITCLDSTPNPASLLDKSLHLKSIAGDALPLGTGLLLPTKVLLQANSRKPIFFGFDEVWFFPHRDIEPRPDSESLVGPSRIDQRKLNKVARWMARNSCSLALGDGDGLNLIVKAHGLVRDLLNHSINSPVLETVKSA